METHDGSIHDANPVPTSTVAAIRRAFERVVALDKDLTVVVITPCYLTKEATEDISIGLVDICDCSILVNTRGLLVLKTADMKVLTIHLICGSSSFASIHSENFVSKITASADEASSVHGAGSDSGSVSEGSETVCSLPTPKNDGAADDGTLDDDDDYYHTCESQDLPW